MFLETPSRSNKNRQSGLSILIDTGYPLRFFCDVVESHHEMIDYIKFGWGTALVTRDIREKIRFAKAHNITVFCGGTLFEKAVLQKRVQEYSDYLSELEIETVEISSGTLSLSLQQKAEYIHQFSRKFKILSEVGYKDSLRSDAFSAEDWITAISNDLSAGATYVLLEARESGQAGICFANGKVREEIFLAIVESVIDRSRLIFEAPTKLLQTFFIHELGSDVNLANIAFSDVLALETLRLGLRSDTFFSAVESTCCASI